MIFDNFSGEQAQGIILAHSIKTANSTFKKGTKLTSQHIAELQQQGYQQILGAKLFDDDIDENTAALTLANLLAGPNTNIGKAVGGRCRIYATTPGLADINKTLIDAINQYGGDVAIATLAEYAMTERNQALASIKVIPFSIKREQLKHYQQLAVTHVTAGIGLTAYQALKVVLVQTINSNNSVNLLARTRKITEQRIDYLGGILIDEYRCAHQQEQIKQVLGQIMKTPVDLILIMGATATVDCNDVIPAAITRCGGNIDHFGMPVEPGNLLLTARHQQRHIVILPGCARAVHANGLDFILPRVFTGQALSKKQIMAMGVGSLLKDNMEKPNWAKQSPKNNNKKPRVAGIILAAGTSTRMPQQNKLLAPIADLPMVSHVVNAAKQSTLNSITVVTGHQSDELTKLLKTNDLTFIVNADHASGMASSLRCGLAALDIDKVDAVLILLADMPFVSSTLINKLIAAFDKKSAQDIVAPVCNNRRGNPVLWSSRYLDELMAIVGDSGGKTLLNKYAEKVKLLVTKDDGSIIDIDTPETLNQWQTSAPTIRGSMVIKND